MAKYINITFPIQDDDNNFFLRRNVTTMEGIKSDLLLLVTTRKGERYFNRDYGTSLMQFIFEPNDRLTESDVEQDIKTTVSKYMSKIIIKNVTFAIEGNVLTMVMYFTYKDDYFSQDDNITLQFEVG